MKLFNMSKTRIIIYSISVFVTFLSIDALLLKKEYHKGIILKKSYSNNTGLIGGSTEGTPFAPIPEQKTDPNGYIFTIINKAKDTIHLKAKKETYIKAHPGDSLKYIKFKGYFTDLLWKVSIFKIMVNIKNRIKFHEEEPTTNIFKKSKPIDI